MNANTQVKLLNVTSSDVGVNWDKEAELVCNKMFILFNELSQEKQYQGFAEISDADLRCDLHNEGKSILSNIEIQAKNSVESELGYADLAGLDNTSFTFEI